MAEDSNTSLLKHIQSLERQGHMSRCTDPKVAPSVVQSLPEEQMKFLLNAAVDDLPLCTFGGRGLTPSATKTNHSYMC